MTAPKLLHSPLLSHVPHAFTTRIGGVSSGIFSSLNFGNPADLPAEHRDPPSNIHENYRLVLDAIGAADRQLVEVHQVHGAAVHTVITGSPAHAAPRDTRADALVTNDPARILAVRIADCAPILLASTDGRIVAAVHAGWRGVIAGVLPGAIAAMRHLGARDIAAAVGPCIGANAFEVGSEVAEEFRRAFGEATPHIRTSSHHKGKFLADIPSALVEQLHAAGITCCDDLGACTASSPDRFYSHRRDLGRTGRMAALIGCVR